ncbi:hypothetical protein BOTBODRAFT_29117 [Botryobasidium botryosum FD-172 SS1]|uniref:G domain-containing protein n=1 Tax=Botryobasidium botryosum (strain FD-172 SS1) TaxID=930990 RepID=A0A067MSZ3_BOTB1|nr:hypothetical protein BOTBODRAFT_29117 [Botryobasidium botryosum FD-172 SS1]
MANLLTLAPVCEEDLVLIAVVGPTGTGKSSFINNALTTDGSSMEVGHKLKSCTVDVAPSPIFRVGGRQVCLVDTPGFDDTDSDVSDTDVLQSIASYLSASYEAGRKLNGLLYFHRISDNRVGGVNAKNMKMFRLLCGKDALKNVVLCTTMWDLLPALSMGEEREEELKADFWQFMLMEGATTARHDGTPQCARYIVSQMLGLDPVDLQIQRELAAGNTKLIETEAGAAVDAELHRLKVDYERRLKELEGTMKEALRENDRTMERVIRLERDRYESKIRKMRRDWERLDGKRQVVIDTLVTKVEKLEASGGCIVC